MKRHTVKAWAVVHQDNNIVIWPAAVGELAIFADDEDAGRVRDLAKGERVIPVTVEWEEE